MKKIFLFFLILPFFLFCEVMAKIDKYKKGDQISGKIQLSKKRNIILPDGQWEVYYRSTVHAANMRFNILSLGKIKNNEFTEFMEIGYSNMAGMYIKYIDPILIEVLFKDQHDGCYERPEYFLLKLYRKGSTHNCFKVGHIDVMKELYNPDDKFNRGYQAPLKKFLRENSEVKLPKIMLGSFHSYFSRTTGGDWIMLAYAIDPKYLNGPKNNYFTEETSEYHKYNIDKFPEHKNIMEKWISIAAKRHKELEYLANSKSKYKLKLDNYIDINKTAKFNSLITDQFNKLNELYKSGSITKEEFSRAKKKLLN
jgi:hypothetical protein